MVNTSTKRFIAVSAMSLMLAVLTVPTWAQGPGGNRGDRGDRGDRQGRGNFDPSRFLEMRLERMQESLGFADAEWTAVKPLVKDVMEAQQSQMMSRMMRFGRGPGGQARPGGDNGPEVPKAVQELQDILEKEDAAANDIKAKLTAYREYRAKQEKELKAKQAKLKEVLTIRQEAMLVMQGMLD